MDTSKIIKGVVSNGRYTVTAPIVKEDYGLYLQIEGVELPETYQVDFSNSENSGTSVTMIGNSDGVLIPHQFIGTGKDVFAFLYHVGADYGRTVYKFRIPNKLRPDRTDDTPTPEEQSVIDQAISALNTAVAQTAQDVISADQSAQSASTDADRAEQAKDDAVTFAQRSANSAQASADYSASASQSAQASANSASQSAQIKADVEDLADDAQGYAESASQSASQASASEQGCARAVLDAASAAAIARARADEASGYAQTASTKASESAQSASQASGYAQTAETAKTAAQTAKTQAETAKDNAVTAKTAAETAQGKAEDAQAAAEAVAESIPSDYSQLSENVSDLKEDFNALEVDLGYVQPAPVMPNGYKQAAYENNAKTRCFKWTGDALVMRFTIGKTGEQAATEQTYGGSLTLNDSMALDMRSSNTPLLVFSYINELEEAANSLIMLRYYNEALTGFKAAYIYLPVGTDEVSVNVEELARTNNIDTNAYPKLIIRGIGDVAHTSTVTGKLEVSIYGYSAENASIVEQVDSLKTRTNALENDVQTLKSRDVYSSSSVMGNPFRFKPMYAHLFLNTVQDADIYVPSQSLYDIQISHRLGFDVIEVNTHLLTDGNYICCHGASGKFGLEFVSADGNSDATVQGTDIATVSLDWVRANVRYKAKYPKMRVSPPTLQEFLYECQKYKMIPLINYKGIDQVEIANSIVGKDNYIMYGAPNSVRNISNCIMNTWANLTTKADILNWVDAVGNPCIVGCMHPEHFTESEWYDVVESVHKKGGLMFYSAYLSNTDQLKMDDYGFDGTGSTYKIPCTDYGNLQNLSSPTGFSDFTVTGGTEADGQLTMSANGTVTPAQSESARFLTGMWLDVTFVGSISVSMGRFITHGNCQSTASASKTIRLSTYGMNIAPTFEIKALTEGTVIENIVFKVSEF